MNPSRNKQSFRYNQHSSLLQASFANFVQLKQFCDVTIVCENGETFSAHRTMLAACSKYFQKFLLNAGMERETYIILKDCHYSDMKLIMEFIYNGSVQVDEEQLVSLQQTAESLKIRSLAEAIRKYMELYGTAKENTLSQKQSNRTKVRALSLSRLSLHQSSPITDSDMSEASSPASSASNGKSGTQQMNSAKREVTSQAATTTTTTNAGVSDPPFKWWNVMPKTEADSPDQSDPYFHNGEDESVHFMEYQYGYTNLPQYESTLPVSTNFITEDQKQIIENLNKSITNDVTNDSAHVKKLIYTLCDKEDLQKRECAPEKVHFVKGEFDKRLDRIEKETGVSTEERKRKFTTYAYKIFNNQQFAKKKKSQ